MFGWYLALKIVIAVLLSLLPRVSGLEAVMVDEVNGVQLLYRNAKKKQKVDKKLDYILTEKSFIKWY